MSFIKILFDKVNGYYFSLVIALITAPEISHASQIVGGGAASVNLMENFRQQLVVSISAAFLGSGLMDFSHSGLMKSLLGICTIIAIFQTIHNHYGSPTFLVEWVKIPIMALIVMCILGQGGIYENLNIFKSARPAGVTAVRTLDTDIYFSLSAIFDELASGINSSFSGSTSASDAYVDEYKKLMTSMGGFTLAISECKNPGTGTDCLLKQFSAIKNTQNGIPNPVPVDKEKEKTAGATAADDLGVWDTVKLFYTKLLIYEAALTTSLPLLLIQALMFLLEYVRIFVNYFTLISFSLMTALSLFFCKLISPFLILPNQRGKVLAAFKLPMSASMYGFMSALIIALAALVIRGINGAITNSLIAKAATDSSIDATDLFQLVIGATISVGAVLLLQIGSMKAIPGLCKSLWNLSLNEIVEFGKTIVEAGFGVVKVAAAVAAGGVMAAGAGIGAAVAGAAKGAASGAGAAGASGASGFGKFIAGAKGAATGGLKQGFSKLGSMTSSMSKDGVAKGGLKRIMGLGDEESSGESTGSGGGSGGGGKSGGSSDSSAPKGGSMGYKAAKGELGKDGEKKPKSAWKEVGGQLFDMAGVAAGGAMALAETGFSVGAGGSGGDIMAQLGQGYKGLVGGAGNIANSVQNHYAQAAEVKAARQARTNEILSVGAGQSGPALEEIDTNKIKQMVGKQTKKGLADQDHEALFKMATTGDFESLEAPDRANFDKLTKSKEFKQYTTKHIKTMSNQISSGNASDEDHANFHQFSVGGQFDRLQAAGAIDKGSSAERNVAATKNHSSTKAWSQQRVEKVDMLRDQIIQADIDGQDYTEQAEQLAELEKRKYLTQQDWKPSGLGKISQVHSERSYLEVEDKIKQANWDLKSAKADKNVGRIMEIEDKLREFKQDQSRYSKPKKR
jgi:hypothetical protein